MPEGDTIRRLANRIQLRFAGQRVGRCVTRDPRLVGVDLAGTILVGADAFGKHLMIRFDDGHTLHAHLLMTGSWSVGPVAREPAWRRRVELWMEDGRLTALDVPILGLLRTTDEPSIIGHLGPDLCGADQPDVDDITARLQRDTTAALAGALLDQRNVAGFGNLYAVELPFIVGISPNQPISTVEGLEGLVALGAAVIRTNAARGPQNTTGRKAPHRRPLDLPQAGPAVPALRDSPRRLGGRREPVAAGVDLVPDMPGRRARPQGRPRPRSAAARPAPRPSRALVPELNGPNGPLIERQQTPQR